MAYPFTDPNIPLTEICRPSNWRGSGALALRVSRPVSYKTAGLQTGAPT